jgi:hypothetical protein
LSTIAEVFEELFYGSGMWLGILLILAMVIGISLKTRYSSVLMLPVCIFMGITYITNGTGNQLWGAIIMFFSAIFLVVNLMKNQT